MPNIRFTRLPGYDINENPRYICHYLNLLTGAEKNNPENIQRVYQGMSQGYHIALERAHKIGGKKYRAKWYGGGIVFQSYNLKELENDIKRVVEEDSKP